jgi:hypothetical protein
MDEMSAMIQFAIDETTPLGQFILSKAEELHKSPEDIVRQLIQERFEQTVRRLHKRFIKGEFSQGKLADLLGLPRIVLIHLLEEMGLNVTNI